MIIKFVSVCVVTSVGVCAKSSIMDDIAFSDWPGQPVDLSSSNPWLPAYGYQQPSALLDKDDFIGNPGRWHAFI